MLYLRDDGVFPEYFQFLLKSVRVKAAQILNHFLLNL